jgi:DNA-binding HxlR family transcriptional regulator
MAKRIDVSESTCPIQRSLGVLGDGWSLLIVRDAHWGLRKFGEFQKDLGIAKNILAARLKTLVACGVLEQTVSGDYLLTDKGRALQPVLEAFQTWGNTYVPRAEIAPV